MVVAVEVTFEAMTRLRSQKVVAPCCAVLGSSRYVDGIALDVWSR